MRRRKTRLLLWIAVAAMTLVVSTGTSAASPSTFNPVADAYTTSDLGASNFGTATVLRVDNSPVARSFLRFNVQGLTGTVTKATLRVFSNSAASSSGVDLRSVADNSWNETTLNHGNAPPVGASIVSHVGAFLSGQWISFDATQLVSGNGLVSMALTTTSSTRRGFQSREDAANPPQLVVETAATTDTTPPAVTLTTPADGSLTADSTPTFSGAAGTLGDDSATVQVRIYSGTSVLGIPVETLTTTRSVGSWSVSASPPLGDGTYTAQADQSDASGNTGLSAPHTFTVDTVAPAVSLTTPPDGSSTIDTTPTFSGGAGAAGGDSSTVTVNTYSGTTPSGSPLLALPAVRSGGSWSIEPASPLAEGTYTARAEQSDSAGNIGFSAANTFAVAASPSDPQPAFPIRAAFHYPWFPEAWNQQGLNPFTKYHPTLGFYDSSSASVIQEHIRAMTYGGIEVGIASWWGQGSRTDGRVPALLSTTRAAGSPFRWALYYEAEGSGDPTVAQLASDLAYIRDRYGSDPAFLRVNGRFVVFVYGDGLDGCGTADRWQQANTGIGAYIVLKVFPLFRTCASQPDGWHQYSPAVAADSQAGFSYAISPGFDKANESAPRLARDLTRWNQNIRDMVASGAPWQLVTTFNEWGEGTTVEGATEWTSSSGFGAYLDALEANGQGAAPPSGDPVIAAAGDIACESTDPNFNGGNGSASNCRQTATSDLIVNGGPDAVLTLGDNQYEDNQLSKFLQSFDLSWGRFKSRIHPGIGNHEYLTPGASGYFDYFNGVGAQSGPAGDRSQGYYSFDIGTWHIIAINSNCSEAGGCDPGSPQETWLRADLAAHSNACTLAYWHHPLFSSGTHGNHSFMGAIWQALYDARADVVLSAHDHDYERFAAQSATGAADLARGIREFVVGTGGMSFSSFGTPQPNSAVRTNNTFGVLELTLHPNGYDWRFIPQAGKSFTDSGTDVCEGTRADTAPPSAPSGLTATPTGSSVDLAWTASTDDDGVAGYEIFRNGTQIASSTTSSYSDSSAQPSTSYSYHVVAYDPTGNRSAASNTAAATTPPPGQLLTSGPSDDAYVHAGNAATNYGARTTLQVDNSPVKNFLLKFSISGIGTRPVVSAKLRLYAVDGSAAGGDFSRVANTAWSEQSVTWANAPVADAAVLASLGAVISGGWYEVDVTPLVSGDGVVSLRVSSGSTNGADYSSKEGAAGFAPQLVVTLG